MIDISVLRALADAGASMEALLAAIEADQKSHHEKMLAKREGNRVRKQRQRERHAVSRVTACDDALRSVTPTPPIPPVSPSLLLSPTPPCNNSTPSPPLPPSPQGRPTDATRASGALRSVEPDGFDEFYQSYPNKVGKQAARKAWPKAIKAIGSLVLMLDAVERYIQQKPPDRQYMNPATFLNGQRWLDQPATVNGHHNGQLQKDGQPTIATVIRAHQEQLRRELSAEEGTDGDDISPSFDHVGWLPGR